MLCYMLRVAPKARRPTRRMFGKWTRLPLLPHMLELRAGPRRRVAEWSTMKGDTVELNLDSYASLARVRRVSTKSTLPKSLTHLM